MARKRSQKIIYLISAFLFAATLLSGCNLESLRASIRDVTLGTVDDVTKRAQNIDEQIKKTKESIDKRVHDIEDAIKKVNDAVDAVKKVGE